MAKTCKWEKEVLGTMNFKDAVRIVSSRYNINAAEAAQEVRLLSDIDGKDISRMAEEDLNAHYDMLEELGEKGRRR